jgi:hypothetical protein
MSISAQVYHNFLQDGDFNFDLTVLLEVLPEAKTFQNYVNQK